MGAGDLPPLLLDWGSYFGLRIKVMPCFWIYTGNISNISGFVQHYWNFATLTHELFPEISVAISPGIISKEKQPHYLAENLSSLAKLCQLCSEKLN